MVAVDVETCSFIARVSSIIIQEDELCWPQAIYAAGRLSASRESKSRGTLLAQT